jgi:RNA recognition motif-containing protein
MCWLFDVLRKLAFEPSDEIFNTAEISILLKMNFVNLSCHVLSICFKCRISAIVIKNHIILRGFGFVTFDSEDGAENAIRSKADGHVINNKSVEVKRAIPRDAEPDQREKNTKMFLGGLNRNTTEDTIKSYFENNFDCVVDSVDLIYEKRDNLQPGQEPKPRFVNFGLLKL